LVRRLVNEGTRNELISDGTPLFDASNIYRPVQATLQPAVHAISVCPLGGLEAGDELACRNTAVVGPSGRDFYITADSAYIWSALEDRDRLLFTQSPACRSAASADSALRGVPATVFQIPLDGSPPRAILAQGEPRNQFSFSASNGGFRALLDQACSGDLTYFQAPLATFSDAPVAASSAQYTSLPDQPDGAQSLENRFTDTHLVYAWRARSDSSMLQRPGGLELTSQVVVVPMASPSSVTQLTAPHDVMRIERVGPNDIVLTGYRDMRGLSVSVLDLDGAVARIAGSLVLPGRYESEGRSHAFNSSVDAAGNGLMGLPTTRARSEAGRLVFESSDSDVSFLTVAGGDTLALAGHLRAVLGQPHPSYTCEVSCVDWYGNARPIFTDGRIFALTGSEVVEGRLRDGQLIEARRVDLTAPLD
jgi:hypothetical protein